MDDLQKRFMEILAGSIPPQGGGAGDGGRKERVEKHIALSGGLDSSALAYVMRGMDLQGHAVITDGFVAPDLAYCQTISSHLGIPLDIISANAADMMPAIEETVRILKNFNDIEIRNAVVMYIAISAVRRIGGRSITTGDGADELFAGYDFMLKKPAGEIKSEQDRMSRIMHFPSKAIGRALGVDVETPFLSAEMIEFARKLPSASMVGLHGGDRYGKMIIRNAIAGHIPDQITWRKKVAMQDGAGTAGLTGMFASTVSDDAFARMQKDVMKRDGVYIRTMESMHYYRTYTKFFGVPARDGGGGAICCPDCGTATGLGSRFCRMCGRFPV